MKTYLKSFSRWHSNCIVLLPLVNFFQYLKMAVKKVRYTNASLQIPMQRMKQIISINEKDKKAIVIAQEIKFARLLSSNDKIIRDRVLKNLRKWLTVRSQSSFSKIYIFIN